MALLLAITDKRVYDTNREVKNDLVYCLQPD